MRLLIACLHHRLSTGRYLYNALGRLGHDVRHVGGYLRDADRHGPHAWQAQGDWNHTWADWRPDVVVYADTVWPDYRHRNYGDIPHAHVCTCNNVVNMRGGPWERHFLASKYNQAWPIQRDNEEWMPCGYSPRWHIPSPIPYAERAFDVALVGRLDVDRNRYLDKLEAAGLKVFRGQGLYYEEYVAAYHDARISLCTNDQHSGMMRYFESAAMGNLILGDTCADMRELGLEFGMASVPGLPGPAAEELLVSMARHYATRPEEAQVIIDQAALWAGDHRWDDRATQIVNWVERVM